jgi:hypothetical protein
VAGQVVQGQIKDAGKWQARHHSGKNKNLEGYKVNQPSASFTSELHEHSDFQDL